MNIYELASFMKAAHKAVGEEWEKLGPERRKRICENVLKRVDARIKANEGGDRCEPTDQKEQKA